MKTLFVMEKWCDGNPARGLTNSFSNILETYPHKGFKVLFIDECLTQGVHCDSVLENVNEGDFDVIMFSFLGNSHFNPSIEKCKQLGEHTKLCFMWPDTGYGWARELILSLDDFVHISWAAEDLPPLTKHHKFLWTAESRRLFYPCEKEVKASFIGSLYGYNDRSRYLNHVKDLVTVSGGQRENALTPEDYAKMIRTSLININFCESPSGEDQVKGRVFESIASQSLLLEKKNDVTSRFFEPGKDYIEFTDEEDLRRLIQYYLNNPDEAKEIAQRGYEKYMKNYTSEIFWKEVQKCLTSH
jgi:hypothetical protein